MRRPAQHRLGPTPAPGWAHPYTGLPGIAVFYNDGGQGGNQPPAAPPAAEPPKPGPPPAPATATFTQEDLERIAAKEKSQGERAGARKALEDLAKEMGFTTPDDVKAFVEAARKAQDEALSEQEKAQKKLQADQQAVATERQTIAAERRTLRREQALSRLGAVDATDDQGNTIPNLQDALAMLDRDLAATPDADEQTVADAAAKLKARRPELFGQTPATSQQPAMPPAPGGAPAGGPPPRQAPAGKPGDRGREMARLRGKIRDTAA